MAYPTNPIYKFVKDTISGNISGLFVTKGGKQWNIPLSEENVMYQEYLEWVAEGNTAEAADQTGQFLILE